LAFARLIALTREFRTHVIHTHSSKDSWLAGIVGRLLGIPVIRTRHVSVPVSTHWLNFAYRIPIRVMTTADLIRNMLVENSLCDAANVCVLPTGVDLARFGEGISGDPFRHEFDLDEGVSAIGLIANLRKSKGVEHFLAAARIMKDAGIPARFFGVGDGHWRDIFIKEAKKLGLGDGTVTFTGYREDIPGIMAGLDILVIASTRTEGIPQVAIQAMAMKLPIVGTDIGGVPESILPASSGVVVPSGDPQALAEAVSHLLGDASRRSRMGVSGRTFVCENHTLEKMLDETERIYNEALVACAS
jgi:glycosyltransferase involved in cell wall biosynthesis